MLDLLAPMIPPYSSCSSSWVRLCVCIMGGREMGKDWGVGKGCTAYISHLEVSYFESSIGTIVPSPLPKVLESPVDNSQVSIINSKTLHSGQRKSSLLTRASANRKTACQERLVEEDFHLPSLLDSFSPPHPPFLLPTLLSVLFPPPTPSCNTGKH